MPKSTSLHRTVVLLTEEVEQLREERDKLRMQLGKVQDEKKQLVLKLKGKAGDDDVPGPVIASVVGHYQEVHARLQGWGPDTSLPEGWLIWRGINGNKQREMFYSPDKRLFYNRKGVEKHLATL